MSRPICVDCDRWAAPGDHLCHDCREAVTAWDNRHGGGASPAYLIAQDRGDGRGPAFRTYDESGEPWWTYRIAEAHRFAVLTQARDRLAAIEAERERAGRRFILKEIAAGDEIAHREIAAEPAYLIGIGAPGGAVRAFASQDRPRRWTADTAEAEPFTDWGAAEAVAHDWNEYLATKGSIERCRVIDADDPEAQP